MGAVKDSLTLLLTKVCFPFNDTEKSFSFFSLSFCFMIAFFLDFLLLSSSFPSSFFSFHLSSFPSLSFLSPKLHSSGRYIFVEKYILPYLALMSPGKKKVPYMEWWNFGLSSEISESQNDQSLNRSKMGNKLNCLFLRLFLQTSFNKQTIKQKNKKRTLVATYQIMVIMVSDNWKRAANSGPV